MQREVRYCTTEDGVRIAYSLEGEGPPLLFAHFVYAFSLSHVVPTFDEAIHRIARGRRLIRYDVRGTGLSQREVDDLSPGAVLRDVEAVVEASGADEVTLLGAAMGGPRAIRYAVRHPDRVAGLVLYESFVRLLDAFRRDVLVAFAQLARANWPLATRTFTDAGVRRQDELEGLRWAEMLEKSAAGDTVAQLIETHLDLDVTDLLGQVACPTLVCHSVNDRLYSFELGQRLASMIPGARLIPLEGDAGGPFTNAQPAIDAMEQFLPAPLRVSAQEGAPPAHLTPREVEILRLVAAGLTSKAISKELDLSIRTVGRHITNIYDKIGTHSRAEASSYAIRRGFTDE